jgi:sugar phosphate isomerase/epimerase
MRLGGPVHVKCEDPEGWVRAVQALGYRAAYCPVKPGTDAATVKAYAGVAERAGIVIAEVGAWSNPLSPDEAQRTTALAGCKQALWLADAIGARCCVNIAG